MDCGRHSNVAPEICRKLRSSFRRCVERHIVIRSKHNYLVIMCVCASLGASLCWCVYPHIGAARTHTSGTKHLFSGSAFCHTLQMEVFKIKVLADAFDAVQHKMYFIMQMKPLAIRLQALFCVRVGAGTQRMGVHLYIWRAGGGMGDD